MGLQKKRNQPIFTKRNVNLCNAFFLLYFLPRLLHEKWLICLYMNQWRNLLFDFYINGKMGKWTYLGKLFSTAIFILWNCFFILTFQALIEHNFTRETHKIFFEEKIFSLQKKLKKNNFCDKQKINTRNTKKKENTNLSRYFFFKCMEMKKR